MSVSLIKRAGHGPLIINRQHVLLIVPITLRSDGNDG